MIDTAFVLKKIFINTLTLFKNESGVEIMDFYISLMHFSIILFLLIITFIIQGDSI